MRLNNIALVAALVFGITSCSEAQQKASKPNPYYTHKGSSKMNLPDSEWKKVLPENTYNILRNKQTEAPGTGQYLHNDAAGTYYCAACGNPLFKSDGKFESGCGWPSFYQPFNDSSIITSVDKSHGMVRTEIMCGRCHGHIGHVFDDGPAPTGQRYCTNGGALHFEGAVKK